MVVLAHDPARDARAFEVVLQCLDEVTPRVETSRPGSCAFATRGTSRYYGGDDRLAERVVMLVGAALGVEAMAIAGPPTVGVADGSFAAVLAAERTVGHGRYVVPAGGSPAFLAPLPVQLLAAGGAHGDRAELTELAELVVLLPRLGITTLGALAALPVVDVLGRFGRAGQLAHRLAAGGDDRPLDAREPPPELTVELVLDPPAEHVEQVAFAVRRLADELHERLEAMGLGCTRLVVAAETEQGERHERCWRHDGSLTAAAIVERVRWQLDGWIQGTRAPTGGVVLVRLVPDEVVPAGGRQLGFWGGQTQADERAVRASARVSGLLGPDAVTVAEWRGGRGPAEAVALVPAETTDLGDPGRRAARVVPGPAAPPWPGSMPPPWPAVVPASPRPAVVLDAAGQPVTVSGRGALSAPPARCTVDDELGRARARPEVVVAWAGPWVCDERWWDAAEHRRRARFQVVTAGGAAHLLSVEGGRWWCEATYD